MRERGKNETAMRTTTTIKATPFRGVFAVCNFAVLAGEMRL
jgi:hypothetical protein